jgi:hypothetical protein
MMLPVASRRRFVCKFTTEPELPGTHGIPRRGPSGVTARHLKCDLRCRLRCNDGWRDGGDYRPRTAGGGALRTNLVKSQAFRTSPMVITLSRHPATAAGPVTRAAGAIGQGSIRWPVLVTAALLEIGYCGNKKPAIEWMEANPAKTLPLGRDDRHIIGSDKPRCVGPVSFGTSRSTAHEAASYGAIRRTRRRPAEHR